MGVPGCHPAPHPAIGGGTPSEREGGIPTTRPTPPEEPTGQLEERSRAPGPRGREATGGGDRRGRAPPDGRDTPRTENRRPGGSGGGAFQELQASHAWHLPTCACLPGLSVHVGQRNLPGADLQALPPRGWRACHPGGPEPEGRALAIPPGQAPAHPRRPCPPPGRVPTGSPRGPRGPGGSPGAGRPLGAPPARQPGGCGLSTAGGRHVLRKRGGQR